MSTSNTATKIWARTFALTGNPNTGKTSLFNALTGLKASTANFPGTTVEWKVGRTKVGEHDIDLIDLPGVYHLSNATPEEQVNHDVIHGDTAEVRQPEAVIITADACNMERSLFLISQVLELTSSVIVALNMVDMATKAGIRINAEQLSQELGCPVIPINARTGEGMEALKLAMESFLGLTEVIPPTTFPCTQCSGCPFESRYSWSDDVTSRCVHASDSPQGQRTEKIDRVLTHPWVGLGAFLSVMLGVFYLIFSVSSVPMDMIDGLFGSLGGWVATMIPEGLLQSFLVDGIIGGVGGVLVFLPQICILFFFLSLLEQSGYLARAAFVMDRLMQRIGLPGTAFVPLLSAHACAIPAIMSTRIIRDKRDRLVTILIAPLMSCSARIPVYAMITALLFPTEPLKAALVFAGAYGLGIFVALIVAFVFGKTILPGKAKPLVLELPSYHLPRLTHAVRFTFDRAMVFIKQAGSIILLISIALWVLATFPRTDTIPTKAEALIAQATLATTPEEASLLAQEAEKITNQHALSHSFAGRMGKAIEPLVKPLGFDWQIGIGIISSFAAREVIVSTLSIVYGLGESDDEAGLYDTLRAATRSDGTPVFTTATSLSLLVFYVLAMQCLPTQAVTKRETNSWKWPIFQLLYMTVLAYVAAFFTFQLFS